MKLVVTFTVALLPILSSAKLSIIYGEDNRIDVNKLKDLRIAKMSKSIAARVPHSSIRDIDGENFSIFNMIISDEWGPNVCSDQKFADQPSMSDCTGFLVGKDLMVTAGHCVMQEGREITNGTTPECSENSWVFDYSYDKNGKLPYKLNSVPKSKVYGCKKIIKAITKNGFDYALIRLDRATKKRAALKINLKSSAMKNDKIFVMGHPSGLPLKHAGGAKVFSVHRSYFSTNLDTFGGNSGSPVFNADTFEVEGILVRGDIDYVHREQGDIACQEVNTCDQNRKNCKEDAEEIDGEHVSHILDLKKYLK